MGVRYTIVYQEEVVRRHIPDLPPTARILIKRAIEERLLIDPVAFGKPLRYSLKGHRRLRVGHYRVVYRLDQTTVVIVAIMHRRDIYEE